MITAEGQKLASRWSQYGQETLDSYLIQDVEHPSFNPQSVLLRAFVADFLFPGEFADFVEDEPYFSACACHLLQANRIGALPEVLAALSEADRDHTLPLFLRSRFRVESSERVPLAALADELTGCVASGFEGFTSPFQDAWRSLLSGRVAARPRILELGCGSANDYRFWHAYGVAPFVDYVGVDVCAANIDSARARFPDVPFVVADACCMDDFESSFDIVVAFDLLEHLSPGGLDAALAEMERLSRNEVWLSLFNAARAPAHRYCEVGSYYWNALSVSEISRHLRKAGYSPEVVSVAVMLERRFPGYRHYNRQAYILLGRRDEAVARS